MFYKDFLLKIRCGRDQNLPQSIMKHIFKFFTLSALLFLTACQSIYNAPTQAEKPTIEISHNDPQWLQHLAKLNQIQTYKAKGIFGYISPDERFSSHFDWQYKAPTSFGLTLSSNLSSKSLKLQRTVSGMTVSDDKGRTRTTQDIDGLMEEIIGISFPIDQFAYWVKGQPERHSHYIINEKRQLAQFDYTVNGSNWRVNFVEYHENRLPNLPKLIVLENGKQTLKIRIDEWVY